MRALLWVVLGLVLGAGVGGAFANLTIPSHEEMRQFAADLVPPGMVTTDVSEISGFELLVGQYEAVAGFDSRGAEVATAADALRDHALELGWTHVRTEPTAAGEVQHWAQEQVAATVHIRNLASSEDGSIYVHYMESPTDRLLAGLAVGGGIGLALAVLLLRVFRRRSRPTTWTQSWALEASPWNGRRRRTTRPRGAASFTRAMDLF